MLHVLVLCQSIECHEKEYWIRFLACIVPLLHQHLQAALRSWHFLFALDLVATEDCSSLVLIVVAALVCLSSLYQLHALSVLARPSMHVVELHCVVSVQQFADFVHVIVVVTLLSLFSLHQVQFLSAVSPISMPSVRLHFVFSFQQFLYLFLNLHFSVVLFVVSAALLTVHLLFQPLVLEVVV